MKLTDIELLAALENLRILNENKTDCYILRVASAIVAKNAGYDSRAEWTEEASAAGLVKYGVVDDIDVAERNYKTLINKLDS